MTTKAIPSPLVPAAAAAALLALAGGAPAGPAELAAQPVETRVMIRAVAHDAKIIGSGVGGARITVRDAGSGEVLARGVQEGGTGDTRRIMTQPRERGEPVFDTEGAAGFVAELELERPTRVEVVAEGPLGTPHAEQRASRTLLLVPGRHVLGDGVILELYGFTVELLEPGGAGGTGAVPPGGPLPVRARVTMLCGCPTEPGGLWDADRIDVVAQLVRDGAVQAEAPLSFVAGEPSTYGGSLRVPAGGEWTLRVLAADAGRASFGMVERTLVAAPREG